MKIGVIGTGNIGGTLARKLAAAGHDVRIANSRGADAVRDLAQEIGATPTDQKGAVQGADCVILAIPFVAMAKLPAGLFDDLPAGVPVVDTSNYYPGILHDPIPAVEAGQVESEWVAEQIGRPVIKAFNMILAPSLKNLSRPSGVPDRLAVTIAGDDAAAKALLAGLVDEIGFDPVDAGPLSESWRQQPSTPVYCCDWTAGEARDALAAAQPGEAPKIRARLMDDMAALPQNATHEDLVRLNRRVNAGR
ncbi:MAG: NAD(P)-binding domain-containing protein [Paracoccus sp. (in: a-proteobacteria)]|uniref:NADPH-dependent F420 reductase n=1 Tax=Paracoccus sp. TaxID=267 RepID=UPI0026DFB406|nr:NAD(P)-binding domain-containing protein [Paracoccus sp. (in: a-proteobacteria)]MDO5622354.1 NAD(P)-binding domain-containing protein [Paracoccus sp. (in: a-proteobacteria)]